MTRKGDWMQLVSGHQFWPLDPREGEIEILDIAHALGNICRFGGHSKFFYSVAQHSCLVSDLLLERDYTPEVALGGLLHDAAEAYVGDMIRPLKKQDVFRFYNEAERAILDVIEARFGMHFSWPAITAADDTMLATEKRDVMNPCPSAWAPLPEPRNTPIKPWLPVVATTEFLSHFNHLYRPRSLTHTLTDKDVPQ